MFHNALPCVRRYSAAMTQPAPGWYPDQTDPRFARWWDGYRWTPYTQPVPQQPHPAQPAPVQQQPYPPQQPSHQAQYRQQYEQGAQRPQQYGHQQAAPLHPPTQQVAPPHAPDGAAQPAQGPADPHGAGQHAGRHSTGAQLGAGPVYTAPALHIVQDKRFFVGMLVGASYAVTDQAGTLLGGVVQVDPGASKQARTYSDDGGGIGLSQHFELFDTSGAPYFHVARALRAQSAAKPRFDVTLPDGAPLGHVESEKLVGRITMGLYASGMRIGQLKLGGIRNNVLNLTDAGGRQVVECARKPPMFSREDAYNLTRPVPLPEPLGTLILAGIIAVDNAFFARTQASLF